MKRQTYEVTITREQLKEAFSKPDPIESLMPIVLEQLSDKIPATPEQDFIKKGR